MVRKSSTVISLPRIGVLELMRMLRQQGQDSGVNTAQFLLVKRNPYQRSGDALRR
jgi:hypothetical protein